MSVYSNFQTDYESYLSSFSLDTSKPLKDQVYGQSNGGYAYESYYLGSFEGTWYDYFMQQTTEQVKTTLLYCEAARALDVELDDEDYASIDSTIANLETTASLYGTTLNTYLASSYGAGVGVKDVKKALELSALATKCSELISEEVIEAVTEDMINDEYADNRVDYDLIDYLMYTVSVKYEDAVKAVLGDDYNENYELDEEQEAAVKAKYIELIDEAEALADEFAAIETEEEFYDTIVNYMLSKAYDEAYDKVDFADEADPIPEPSEADKKTVKEKTIASILAAFEANKDKDDATVSGDAKKNDDGKWMLYDIEVDAEYATELNTIYKNLYANFVTNEDTFTKEGVSFSDTNEFILGAFKDLLGSEEETEEVDKVDVGGTKVLYAGDEDLADQDDDYVMYEYYNANVYMLLLTSKCLLALLPMCLIPRLCLNSR